MKRASPLRFLVTAAACLPTALLLLTTSCGKSATNPHQPAPASQQASTSAAAPKRVPSSVMESPVEPATVPAEEKRLTEERVFGQRAATPSSDQLPSSLPDDVIEKDLARLKKGNLAFNTPKKMKTGNTAHLVARIASENISLQALESGMPAGQGTSTETEATPISVRMKMTLKGADFEITPLSSEEQIVGGETPTEWQWDVVPKHAGTLRLHLAAIVELSNLSRDFTTVDRDIAVQVDPVDAVTKFAEGNTVWILGTAGAGVTGLWAWWRRRKKAKPPDWETP